MKALEDLKEMLEEEMKKIVKKGDISPTELDSAYKAVDVIKDIETIKAMKEADWGGGEEQQYSQRRGYYSMERYPMMNSYNDVGGQSNNRGSYDGQSNRGSYNSSYNSYEGQSNARNSYEQSNDGRRGRDGDSDGRYSEDGSYARGRDAMGRYTSRDGGSYEYSRHTEKEKMIEKLEKMMDTASSEKERQAIRQCIEKLEG